MSVPATDRIRGLSVSVVALVAWATVIYLLPRLLTSGPYALANKVPLLIFWYQYAYPYYTFYPPPNEQVMVWPGYWVIFWAALSVAFVALSNRLRPATCLLAAGGFVMFGTLVLHFLIALFNLHFELDTP